MTKVKAIFFALVMICGTLAGCNHNPSPPDTDGDGVVDSIDLCPSTPAGETVDADGCGQSQLDDDNDLVMNDMDICPNTPAGETVNAVGCSSSQLDDDGDGRTGTLTGRVRQAPWKGRWCLVSEALLVVWSE